MLKGLVFKTKTIEAIPLEKTIGFFYPMELKLCTLIQLLISNNPVFFALIFLFSRFLAGKSSHGDKSKFSFLCYGRLNKYTVILKELVDTKSYAKKKKNGKSSIRLQNMRLASLNFPQFCYRTFTKFKSFPTVQLQALCWPAVNQGNRI